MKPFYFLSADDTIKHFATSDHEGLSDSEARKRLEEYGFNQLEAKGKKSFLRMFLEQFKSFMIIILLIAAAISGFVGVMEGEGLLDTFVILGILTLNAFIGAYQEKKAELSLQALKNLAAPETKVIRNGSVLEIPSMELVPGDIVILETGDIIPADMRLTGAVNLKIQESAMTGESVPVEKHTDPLEDENAALGDRVNMAFSSGTVTYGRGKGVVVATGMNSEVGKIANMLQQTVDTETPMTRRLEHLGRILGTAALIICAVIFVVGVIYGNSVLSMFMTAVSLAVAAIPEGLPAVSTIVLAIGVQRLVKRNAIIRTLPSVETLGSATVICSDKTGTLTQNRMTIVEAYVNHRRDTINRNSPGVSLNSEEEKLLMTAVLCADATMRVNEEGENEFTGDPTETALLDFGILYSIFKEEAERSFPRVAEIPFDSERKRMTTINKMTDNSFRINTKGGLEEILNVCNRIVISGEVRELTKEDIGLIRESNESMANSALRVLAMAYKDLSQKPGKINTGEIEKDLIFTGFLGMRDPARAEVKDAVARCSTAGIRPVMITGDHKATAMAIARETGILREGDLAITGSELELIEEEEFRRNVSRYSVYARVAPEHKVRIVKAWQSHNEIVAMTGDGVNDAPALKQADIGAAMGIVGTDVAKGAADMVLTDDNFATIVSAVEEGRRIYDNILKAIQFLLSTNVGEIFLLLITAIFNWGTPLLPIHILWINLVTDSLPALALSVDPPESNIMNRKPRNSKRGFMTRGMVWRIMYQGIMVGAIPLIAFMIGKRDGGLILGQTMAFATLAFSQLIHVRNLHSNSRSSLSISPLKNKPLIGAIFVSAALALLVLIIPPVRDAFSFTEMDSKHWLMVLLMSFIPIPVVDIFKLLGINGTKNDN
ncbi:MAG TPA: calcium-translocating P-type ATPase, PMCA-type [Bacteroidales bacterium]|nr:calcium-translocating P-type ATPase, PMCA-type [Bacteroidales bacterium]HPJ59921.1 calcium-translocating P-type ATPase, PMCA-type [Bacteroidales bacterium]HPR12309.1 calcium-translocating P-type ATPase, PMCA-type [Bacteroidales bacterium]